MRLKRWKWPKWRWGRKGNPPRNERLEPENTSERKKEETSTQTTNFWVPFQFSRVYVLGNKTAHLLQKENHLQACSFLKEYGRVPGEGISKKHVLSVCLWSHFNVLESNNESSGLLQICKLKRFNFQIYEGSFGFLNLEFFELLPSTYTPRNLTWILMILTIAICLKEFTLSNPSFWISMLVFGGVTTKTTN